MARPSIGCKLILGVAIGLALGRFARADDPPPLNSNSSDAPSTERPRSTRTSPGKPFAAANVIRAFQRDQESVRFTLLERIERYHLNDAKVPEALIKAIFSDIQARRTPDSLIYAVQLLARCTHLNASGQLCPLVRCSEPIVALTAADAAAAAGHPEALTPTIHLADRADFHDSYAFRHVVISAVGRYDDADAVDFLVRTVDKTEGQAKYVAACRLTQLTGQNFGGRPADWSTWWSANRSSFASTRAAKKTKPNRAPDPAADLVDLPWDSDLPRFYGLPLYAKKVVFVIDRSKSMESTVNDETRLARAQKELIAAVGKLEESTEFTILAYDSSLLPWEKTLQQATSESKTRAVEFVKQLYPGNMTACYDALAEGLKFDKDLEAIYLLTDGLPTIGRLTEPNAIVRALTRQNQRQRTSLNTVIIDAKPNSEHFLRSLSHDNFGWYLAVR